ncbi:hypothetical protein AHAS_Ahas20G0189900 [Arachis hypogaea]
MGYFLLQKYRDHLFHFCNGRGVISCIQKVCRHISLQWQMCYFLRAVDPVVAEGLFPVHMSIANRKAISGW